MKKKSFALFFLLFLNGISFAQNLSSKDSITLKDISYGKSSEQILDIFLPANRNASTKVFILLHGGGWSKGSKENMDYMVHNLKNEFPNYAIMSLGYRLATPESPAFPKQIEDIEMVFSFLKSKKDNYFISDNFAFVGSSAGAHLALLYSYGFDKNMNVKAVCSIIGPTDFTDPSYTDNPNYSEGRLKNLVGNGITYAKNPEFFQKVSPVSYVSEKSQPTILFYGEADPLVPKTQGGLLKKILDKNKIYNEYYLYPGEGHGKWNKENSLDIRRKMFDFFKKYF